MMIRVHTNIRSTKRPSAAPWVYSVHKARPPVCRSPLPKNSDRKLSLRTKWSNLAFLRRDCHAPYGCSQWREESSDCEVYRCSWAL